MKRAGKYDFSDVFLYTSQSINHWQEPKETLDCVIRLVFCQDQGVNLENEQFSV